MIPTVLRKSPQAPQDLGPHSLLPSAPTILILPHSPPDTWPLCFPLPQGLCTCWHPSPRSTFAQTHTSFESPLIIPDAWVTQPPPPPHPVGDPSTAPAWPQRALWLSVGHEGDGVQGFAAPREQHGAHGAEQESVTEQHQGGKCVWDAPVPVSGPSSSPWLALWPCALDRPEPSLAHGLGQS